MPGDPQQGPSTVPAPSTGLQGVQSVPAAQGAPGAPGVPVVRDQSRRVPGVAQQAQPGRGYPQHTPIQYGQPGIPVPQYGQAMSQNPRAAPTSSVPRNYYGAPAGFQAYPPNMSFIPHPRPQANYRMAPNQVYSNPFPYPGYGAPAAPAAQVPPGAALMQPHEYSQQAPRRAAPAPFQPRENRALKIIDPETNSEIRADSKPLPDPAPGSTLEAKVVPVVADQVVPEKPKPAAKTVSKPVAKPVAKPVVEAVEVKKMNVTPVKTLDSAKKEKKSEVKPAVEASPVVEAPVKSSSVPAVPSKEADTTLSPVTPAQTASAAEAVSAVPSTPVTEEKPSPEVVKAKSSESSREVEAPSVAQKHTTPKDVSVPESVKEKLKPVDSSVNEGATNSPSSGHGDAAASVATKQSTESGTPTAEKEADEAPSGPPKRVRPPSPIFTENERKVYSADWILEMRSFIDTSKNTKFEAALLKANISKRSAANPRMDRGGRRSGGGGSGVLSDDPRGRAAPMTSGNFNMSGRNSSVYATGDAFDMGLARRQAPPPIAGGGGGGGGGRNDPRGRRSQGPNRFDGPNRFGVGPLDPVMHNFPVEKLEKGENGWKRNKEADDEITAKVKKVRSLLNKLTIEKFDKIVGQIVEIDISSVEVLRGIVDEVFEKALFEPKFSNMYAELCKRLDDLTREMLQRISDSTGKPLNFRRILLNNCQVEFTRFAESGAAALKNDAEAAKSKTGSKDDAADKEGEDSEAKKLTADEEKARKEAEALALSRAKKRMLANVRFIGSLYCQDLISDKIIHINCIQPLLKSSINDKEEETLEALCKLIANTGYKLSQNEKAREVVDKYFTPIRKLSADHTLPARVRFMIQDLLEQRANNWKARREEASAKKISEIHKDIEKEEQAKAQAQAQARDRRGRGGGGGGHRDRHHRFSAPVQMTMAPRQASGGGQSRASAQLEKFANRGGSNFGNRGANMQNVRLGPGGGGRGGSGANGWKSSTGGLSSRTSSGGGGGASLRPRSRNAFAALDTDNKDNATSSSGSGDVRRGNRFNTSALSGSGSSSAKPAPPKPVDTKLSAADVKRKAKSIVSEFWDIKDMGEAKICLAEEVTPANYTKWLEMAIRFSVDGKVTNRPLSGPLFSGLLQEGVFTRAHIVEAFTDVIGDLDNIEMDNPRASESIALYIAAVAATGKLGGKDETGLSFLPDAIGKIGMLKRAVKMVVLTLREYGKAISESVKDEKVREKKIVDILKSFKFDLVGKMLEFNPMRGMESLEDLLEDTKMKYLLPMLPAERIITGLIAQEKSGQELHEGLKKLKLSSEDVKGSAFTTMVVRVALTAMFMESKDELVKCFKHGAGALITMCNDGGSPSEKVQMDVVLEVQSLLNKKESEFAPLIEKQYAGKKYGFVAFEILYDADIVVEEVFDAWKDDDKTSMEVEGKPNLLLQTGAFFKWLAEAETE